MQWQQHLRTIQSKVRMKSIHLPHHANHAKLQAFGNTLRLRLFLTSELVFIANYCFRYAHSSGKISCCTKRLVTTSLRSNVVLLSITTQSPNERELIAALIRTRSLSASIAVDQQRSSLIPGACSSSLYCGIPKSILASEVASAAYCTRDHQGMVEVKVADTITDELRRVWSARGVSPLAR